MFHSAELQYLFQKTERETSLHLRLWVGRIWIISGIMLGLGSGAAWLTYAAQPMFFASAQILQSAPEQSLPGFATLIPAISGDNSANTSAQLIRSKSNLLNVIKRHNLVADAEFNPTLVGSGPLPNLDQIFGFAPSTYSYADQIILTLGHLDEAVELTVLPGTRIFEISVASVSPEKSARLANSIAEGFLSAVAKQAADVQGLNERYFESKLSELRAENDEAAREVTFLLATATAIRPEELVKDARALAQATETYDQGRSDTRIGAAQMRATEEYINNHSDIVVQKSKDLLAYQTAERRLNAATGALQVLQSQISEFQLHSATKEPEFTILEWATEPVLPAFPNVEMTLVFAAFAGAVLGGLIAALRPIRPQRKARQP